MPEMDNACQASIQRNHTKRLGVWGHALGKDITSMARHQFTREERQRGGKARAQQPDFVEACRKGFQVTLERHPFYARKWLKRKLRDQRWEKQAHEQSDTAERH